MTKITKALLGSLVATVLISASPARAARGEGQLRPRVFAGTLTVFVEDDFAQGRATKRFSVHDPNLGRDFELRIHGRNGDDLKTGMKVHVTAGPVEDVVTVDAPADDLMNLASAAAASTRRALTILVDIRDSSNTLHAISSTCDGATAQSAAILFGGSGTTAHVDGSYQDSSFRAVGWGGAAYPGSSIDVVRVTVAEPSTTYSTSCNYTPWANAADTAATSLGINLANYQHRIYVLPADVGCGWAGLGVISCGTSCRAWIKAYATQPCGYSDCYAHELGHNIGFYHASTDTNNDGTIDCEYCDESDFMGYAQANLRTQNGPHKVQMGWVSGPSIVDGSGGGQFTIAALEQSLTSQPLIVKIVPGTGKAYYLSYRAPMGYDATIPKPATYANRTNIHRWSTGNSLFIASLGDGQSFQDPVNGITITQTGHDAGSATVTVSTTLTPPAPRAPLVGASPANQLTNVLPAMKTFTLSVTNNDSAGSASSVFNLSFAAPSGWTGNIVPSSLTLAPGLSGTATMSLTAPGGTVDGNYTVSGATVADAAHASVSAGVTYSIDTTLPTAPSGLSAVAGKRSKVNLRWSASTDNGGSGVSMYRVYRNGTLAGTATGTTYVDSPGIGTWTYTVSAIDAAGNLSASSNSASFTISSGRR